MQQTGFLVLGVLVSVPLIGCLDDRQYAGGPSGQDTADADIEDSAPAADAVVPEDALPGDAGNTPADVQRQAEDTGPAAQPCHCQEDQVWLVGACVPTPLLGCGESCSVDDASGCSEDWQCDPTAATPLCTTSSSVPACRPPAAMSFVDGDLRTHPTAATVGEEVGVTVRGGLFYVGALFWMMRIGDELLEPLIDWDTTCTISIPWTPTQAGTFPVHVAYGSGGSPNIGWTLAGFISVDVPSQDTQPGFSCSAETTCAQATPYTCTCQDEQCACTIDE